MNTILIIEDDENMAELVRLKLRQTGFAVYIANAAEEGLEMAHSTRPDAIILDIMLPEINGLEICRYLRENSATSQIPVLMLTGKARQEDRLNGFAAGADDYVTKPCDMAELAYRVSALLRRNVPHHPAKLVTAGEFTLSRTAMKINLAGRALDLTSTEFKLLALLIERSGKVLSREWLLMEVWGYQPTMDTRTLDTHIRRLREKLGNEGKNIETLRGQGYRLSSATKVARSIFAS